MIDAAPWENNNVTKKTPKKSAAKQPKEPSVMVPLRLPPAIVKELDEVTERSGNTRSSLIQLAVAEWLDRRKKAE